MNATMRKVVIGATAVSMALAVAACGKAGDNNKKSSGTTSGGKTSIGLLLPDNTQTRYEQFDRPLFTAKVKELCSGCSVQYANANADAAKQAQQVSSMI